MERSLLSDFELKEREVERLRRERERRAMEEEVLQEVKWREGNTVAMCVAAWKKTTTITILMTSCAFHS